MKCTLLALLLAGLISACREDDNYQRALPLVHDGEISVLMNGEDVPPELTSRLTATIGSSLSCFPDKLTLLAIYSINEDIQRRAFGINNIPLQAGDYTISRIETGNQVCDSDTITAYFGTSVADGDVTGEFYLPIEGEDNFISVTSYNETTKEIEGTFQITFAIELEDHRPFKTGAYAPDTVRLTQGQFSAVVRQQ